ncbi:MAG TPA: hypothetical protein VG841_08805 [Caulobacterales bacterium]|nr:hypothetical protein [Caulobacterales bacterium]
MRPPVPTQAQLLAKNRARARLDNKRRYRRLLSLGFGAAGLAVAVTGMPLSVSIALWALSAASWMLLKAV